MALVPGWAFLFEKIAFPKESTTDKVVKKCTDCNNAEGRESKILMCFRSAFIKNADFTLVLPFADGVENYLKVQKYEKTQRCMQV